MAKVKTSFPITGKFGNYSRYTRKGSDQIITRSRGGGSKSKIKKSKKAANVRLSNSEFAGAGKTSGKIQCAMYAVKHLAEPVLSGRLTAVATQIQKRDLENSVGKRSILFSKYPGILNGFSINADIPFDTYLKNPMEYSISRSNLSATIVVPELMNKINFDTPAGFPLYRVIAVLGIVPDMIRGATEYEPVNNRIIYAPRQDQTDWIAVKSKPTSRSLNIQLLENSNFDDSCSLILCVGIEFGKYVSDELVTPGKDVGSAKILAHV